MFDKEPEDMFAGTDVPTPAPPAGSASRPAVVSPPASPVSQIGGAAAPSATPSAEAIHPAGHMSGTKLLLIIIGAVVVVGAAGYLSFMLLGSKEPVVPQEQAPAPTGGRLTPEEVNLGGTAPVVPEPTPVAPVEPEPVVPMPVVVEVDTDKDGLSDAEEARLGTDSAKNDTDEDGLNDREEVVIYKTNPLITDTDGDTYLDGSEVRNGYNPAGPGKLLTVPTQAP